jgi:hypothetical protein
MTYHTIAIERINVFYREAALRARRPSCCCTTIPRKANRFPPARMTEAGERTSGGSRKRRRGNPIASRQAGIREAMTQIRTAGTLPTIG